MPLRLGDADDLASLPELDEAILLEELKIRYTDGRIYVRKWTGRSVLECPTSYHLLAKSRVVFLH